MANPFFRNPLGFATSFLRKAIGSVARIVRDPLSRILRPEFLVGQIGGALGTIGRALAGLGAVVEAGALRREALREAEIAVATGVVEGLPSDLIIDDATIPDAVTRIRRRYAWTIRVRYIDPTTGERIERFITVATDRQITREEAIATAEEETFPESPKIAGAIIDSELVRVVKAGEAGRL